MEGKEIAYIPHRNGSSPGWIHDFALSANYAIVIEPPIYFNLLSILTGDEPQCSRSREGFRRACTTTLAFRFSGLETDYVFMDWKPEYPTRVHVVDIKTGSVTTKVACDVHGSMPFDVAIAAAPCMFSLLHGQFMG